jgi:hypothetical protein
MKTRENLLASKRYHGEKETAKFIFTTVEALSLPDVRMIGGSAVKASLYADHSIAPMYIDKSIDTDFAVGSIDSLQRIAVAKNATLAEAGHVWPHGIVKLGEKRDEMPSPFKSWSLQQFKEVDMLFPTVCAIPITAKALEKPITVVMDGVRLQVANLPFLLATHLNPVAAVNERLTKAFFLVSDFAARNSMAELRDAILAQAMLHIAEGERVVALKTEDMRIKGSEADTRILETEEFRDYAGYLKVKTPNFFQNKHKELARKAESLGVCDRKTALAVGREVMRWLREDYDAAKAEVSG